MSWFAEPRLIPPRSGVASFDPSPRFIAVADHIVSQGKEQVPSMKLSRILVAVAGAALLGFAAGCHRMGARPPLSDRPVHAAPAPAEGSAPAYRPSEGS